MTRLATVLTRMDFPEAELCTLRLDGEVYALDDCAVSIDEIASVFLRAAVLRSELPPRLIAEQRSAAWVWGAFEIPPSPHEVCSPIESRTRPSVQLALRVREVVVNPSDLVSVSGIRLTSPQRTAIDLARFSPDWSPELVLATSRLMRIGGFTSTDCSRAMNRRRNLPGKVLALRRLARADAVDVVDGVDASHRVQNAVEVRGVAHLEDEPAEGQSVA